MVVGGKRKTWKTFLLFLHFGWSGYTQYTLFSRSSSLRVQSVIEQSRSLVCLFEVQS